MFFVYLFIIFVFILIIFLAIFPVFFWHKPLIPPKEEQESAKRFLENASPRLKMACTYECPHCGSHSLLPYNSETVLMCFECGYSWDVDYILSVFDTFQDM